MNSLTRRLNRPREILQHERLETKRAKGKKICPKLRLFAEEFINLAENPGAFRMGTKMARGHPA